jgi:hypothetical protein
MSGRSRRLHRLQEPPGMVVEEEERKGGGGGGPEWKGCLLASGLRRHGGRGARQREDARGR